MHVIEAITKGLHVTRYVRVTRALRARYVRVTCSLRARYVRVTCALCAHNTHITEEDYAILAVYYVHVMAANVCGTCIRILLIGETLAAPAARHSTPLTPGLRTGETAHTPQGRQHTHHHTWKRHTQYTRDRLENFMRTRDVAWNIPRGPST